MDTNFIRGGQGEQVDDGGGNVGWVADSDGEISADSAVRVMVTVPAGLTFWPSGNGTKVSALAAPVQVMTAAEAELKSARSSAQAARAGRRRFREDGGVFGAVVAAWGVLILQLSSRPKHVFAIRVHDSEPPVLRQRQAPL